MPIEPSHHPGKFRNVQALRAMAAAAVAFSHALHEFGFARSAYPFQMGVDVFFVISGFVMVYSSRGLFGRRQAFKVFASRRLMRIVPLYWLYTILVAFVTATRPGLLRTAHFNPTHLILSLFFIPHRAPEGTLEPLLGLGWTLNYEMYFYLVFAAFLFLPLPKMLAAVTCFFTGAVIAGSIVPFGNDALYFWTRPICLEFVAGAGLGYLFVTGRRAPGWTFAFCPLVALAFAPLHRTGIVPLTQAAAIGFVALAILPRGLETASIPRALFELGEGSYSVYLSHPFTLRLWSLVAAFMRWPPTISCAVATVGTIAFGYLLHRAVERPLVSALPRLGPAPLASAEQ